MVFATFMARLFPATRFRVEHRTLREDLKGGEHGTFPGQRAFLALGGGAPWAWVSACSFIASGGTGAITFLDHKTLKPREAYANGLVELYQRRTSDSVFDYLAVKKKHKHVPQVYGEPWKV